MLVLNIKNVLLKILDISYGGTGFATADPKDILTEPVKMGAPRIIVVHNHPTGDPTPSKEDIKFTKRLYVASGYLGIDLIDHIIIGYDKYISIFSTERIREEQ